MTLTSTTTKIQYNGDDSTVSFPITFIYWLDADIKAILTDAAGVETTWADGKQYTLTGGEGSTGTLTVEVSPTDYTPAAGETLTIKSIVPNTQTTSLPLGGALPSSSIEERLDKNVRLIQQRGEELDRAMLLSEASALSNLEFPAPGAGNYIRWAADGLSLEAVSAVNDSGSFLQSGTGAVSRTVTSKIGEVISVKDFGATGDGVTDDTLNIQNAIDSVASGTVVYFPTGNYVITSKITIPSNTTLRGGGPLLNPRLLW
jgi:polygalacturonase